MNIQQAIEQAKGNPITNSNITFRVDENGMFRDIEHNQVAITNAKDLFAEWVIIE